MNGFLLLNTIRFVHGSGNRVEENLFFIIELGSSLFGHEYGQKFLIIAVLKCYSMGGIKG